MNILNEIAERTRQRITEEKKRLPLEEIRRRAEQADGGEMTYPFEAALRKKGLSFICEVKKASPSKGIIAEEFPHVTIAKEYEEAGADAISCLTEPYYFLGRDAYLTSVVEEVSIPVLRKDFTVDEYMIYQAKCMGASAVLLICAILEPGQLKAYQQLARELGVSALVEAHTEAEVAMAVDAGAGIIGVNNRNLKDFTVDVSQSSRLRKLVPPEILFVSESGVADRSDVEILVHNGVDGVLIGEMLMRAKDKKRTLRQLRGLV